MGFSLPDTLIVFDGVADSESESDRDASELLGGGNGAADAEAAGPDLDSLEGMMIVDPGRTFTPSLPL